MTGKTWCRRSKTIKSILIWIIWGQMNEEVLNQFLKDYEKASNSHDFKKVKPFIDENASYEFTDGSFKGIDEIQKAFEKTFDKI